VPALLAQSERQARRFVSELVKRGVVISASTRAPLRLNFPARLAPRWVPGLFPEHGGWQAGEELRSSPACVRCRDAPAPIRHARACPVEQARDRVLRAARWKRASCAFSASCQRPRPAATRRRW